jgi:hypothetical protein
MKFALERWEPAHASWVALGTFNTRAEAKARAFELASSQGHGATPSQGHGARETERTTASEPASDRSRRPLVAIGVLGEASDEIFAGSWGQWPDHRRRFERRRSAGTFIAGVVGGGSASSIFGLSLDRYYSPSTTKS